MGGTVGRGKGRPSSLLLLCFLGGNQEDAASDGFIGNCDVVRRRRTLEMRLEEGGGGRGVEVGGRRRGRK